MRMSSLVVRLCLAVSLLVVATAPASAYTVLKTYIGASKYWPGSEASWTVGTSGMPGVDWMAVFSGLDASSLRNIAMQ